MQVTRFSPLEMPIFQTFPLKHKPTCISIVSKSRESLTMIDELPHRGIAIVGTRHPQKRSLDFMEEVILQLKKADLILLSGFARGVDAHAHELALKHGLRTIAFLGCGIDINYPFEHRDLKENILNAGGLVVSQFADDETPYRSNFLDRNALIAGFSQATWVVEAAEISGSLNTAKHAGDMFRDLYATPAFPKDPYFQGNAKLLDQLKPDRIHYARPIFKAASLGYTWPELFETEVASQPELPLRFSPKSDLQRWVSELSTLMGECRVQALMEYAHRSGMTFGDFYRELEKEIAAGSLKQNELGVVAIA